MFFKKFKDEVEYYDIEDFLAFKVIGFLLIAFLVATVNIVAVHDILDSQSTPYDESLLVMSMTGIISIGLTYFSFSYLTNVIIGTYHYLGSFSLPRKKEEMISFKMETLFDVTLKNPIFYLTSLCLGHLVGAIERHTYIKAISEFKPWENTLSYFLTYLKYPIMIFFFGIILISFVYLTIVAFQKPTIHLLKKYYSPNGTNSILTFFRAIGYYAKNKSVLMTFFGILPSFAFVLQMTGAFAEKMTSLDWLLLYVESLVIGYPLLVLASAIISEVKRAKEVKEEQTERKTVIDGQTAKAKQTSYETVAPIVLSDFVDEEVQKVINDINKIVNDVNPYLQLTDIEEAHVLKRITEEEILNLIKHYNKLPNDTKAELKNELLARLEDAKAVAKEIAQISKNYHYQAFKKQAEIMNKRYHDKG